MAEDKRTELCYIVAPSYSGTTLLTFLLNTHPEIATIGELKGKMGDDFAIPELCSCGETMKACPLWRAVAAEVQSRGSLLDVSDFGTAFRAPTQLLADRLMRARVRGAGFEWLREHLLRLPGPQQALADVLGRNRLLIDAILSVKGGRIFVDSSKDAIRLKLMLRSGLWDIKVIHLTRDGRATANSSKNWKGTSTRKATLGWRRPHEQSQKILSRCEGAVPYLHVRYEELATRPAETLGEVLDFLGLEGRARLDFRTADNHILGNSMRLGESSEIVLDEKWRKQLTNADLWTFERLGGALNRTFRAPTGRRCTICGHGGFDFVLAVGDVRYKTSDQPFEVECCRHCGCLVTTRDAKLFDPKESYPSDYWGPVALQTEPRKRPFRRPRLAERLRHLTRHTPIASDRLSWAFEAGLGEGARVLDVGCGTGEVGEYLIQRYGCEVVGIEPDTAAAQIARGRGLEVHEGTLHTFSQGTADHDGAFDVALLIHVLEHLKAPIESLQGIHRCLRPGGRLVVALPNAASWERRAFGRYWDGWDIPRHIHHFSPRSLGCALRAAGFAVRDLSYEWYSLLWRSVANRLLPNLSHRERRRRVRWLPLEAVWGLALAGLKRSSALQVIAVRVPMETAPPRSPREENA